MSGERRSRLPAARAGVSEAPVFAALGDETRLSLVAALCRRAALSVTRLSEGAAVTRQAIRKHLRVLEHAGVVASERQGRETLFRLEPDGLDEARRYLDRVSAEWDRALARLKAFVEAGGGEAGGGEAGSGERRRRRGATSGRASRTRPRRGLPGRRAPG